MRKGSSSIACIRSYVPGVLSGCVMRIGSALCACIRCNCGRFYCAGTKYSGVCSGGIARMFGAQRTVSRAYNTCAEHTFRRVFYAQYTAFSGAESFYRAHTICAEYCVPGVLSGGDAVFYRSSFPSSKGSGKRISRIGRAVSTYRAYVPGMCSNRAALYSGTGISAGLSLSGVSSGLFFSIASFSSSLPFSFASLGRREDAST